MGDWRVGGAGRERREWEEQKSPIPADMGEIGVVHGKIAN